MTRTERERQEGRPPAKKCLDSALTNLHLLRTIMHALGVFRLEPGSRLQSSKDGLLHFCTNVNSRRWGYQMTIYIYLIFSLLFLVDESKIEGAARR